MKQRSGAGCAGDPSRTEVGRSARNGQARGCSCLWFAGVSAVLGPTGWFLLSLLVVASAGVRRPECLASAVRLWCERKETWLHRYFMLCND